MTTIRDVAALAGVSATTVSHVLNGTRHVEPATAARVRRAVDELGFRPNALAASMRGGPTRTVGLVIPDIANPFFANLARAIEDATFERGYSAILCNSDGDASKEARYIDILLRKKVDGLLLISAGLSSERLRDILRAAPPVVVIDRELEGLPVPQILVDNQQGGRLAGEYITSLGHRCIAVIAGADVLRPSARRLDGFREALAAAGVELRRDLIARGNFQAAGGRAAMLDLMARERGVTAVFAENDMMAIGALGAAQHAGIRVPADLTILGFDDISFSAAVTPELTTVAQPIEELAATATRLLFARLADRQAPPERIILPVSLVVRGSCAAAPSRREAAGRTAQR